MTTFADRLCDAILDGPSDGGEAADLLNLLLVEIGEVDPHAARRLGLAMMNLPAGAFGRHLLAVADRRLVSHGAEDIPAMIAASLGRWFVGGARSRG